MARRSRGFDPRQEHFAGLARLHAKSVLTGLAQLVEHQAFNLVVAGSTPAVGTFAFLALVVEHLSCKEKALGSNPRGGTFFYGLVVTKKNAELTQSVMKDIYFSTGVITIIAIVEAVGLYFIRLGGIVNTSTASLLYAFGVVPLLSWASKHIGIGLSNYIWNILTTLFGFGIGIYIFKEKLHNMQIAGVLVSFVGLTMILLDPDAK